MRLFAKHDSDGGGMFMVTPEEAKRLNKQGYGIHHTVNQFDWSKVEKTGKGRTKDNVTKVLFWTAESDELSFMEQFAKLNTFCSPSVIVQSKKSLHAYWVAKEASIENYPVIQEALAEYFCGDKGLKNVAHTLRTPGYYHLKDPNDPILVQKIYQEVVPYTEDMFVRALERKLGRSLFKKEVTPITYTPHNDGDSFFDKLNTMNQGELLLRLSGRISGDKIELKRVTDRKQNIWVNGRSLQAWIDEDGMIGSSNNGGPTVLQWIQWYGYSKSQAVEMIKDAIPELSDF